MANDPPRPPWQQKNQKSRLPRSEFPVVTGDHVYLCDCQKPVWKPEIGASGANSPGKAFCYPHFASISATVWLAIVTCCPAEDLILNYGFDVENSTLLLWLPPKPEAYYTLEWTEDWVTFIPVSMVVGHSGPNWAYSVTVGANAGFFRVQSHDIFSPQDSDADGIDDRFELEHPDCLDPLNWLDASQSCLADGISNYQFYLRELFGNPGLALQFFSRETTIWNFGEPTARIEAISPEISIYNSNPGSGPPTSDILQVYSREVTSWNFGAPSARYEAISREVTTWNFGSPSAPIEAISPEISVYNAFPGSGPPTTAFQQVHSRELTVFNLGQPTAVFEAISREMTLLNFEEPVNP